jgi:2'-5' RNA ligase
VRESAVVIGVPEAAPLVEGWRRQHTYDGPLGVPAHVTLLYPFVPAERIDDAKPRVAQIVAQAPVFDAVFRRTARFPSVLYLAPEPAERFLALTKALVAEWPEHPPYAGAVDVDGVIPHLTVAESEDARLLDAIAAELEPKLPIETHVDSAALLVEDGSRRWHEHSRLPLARI